MKILAVADDVDAVITSVRLREPLQALCAATGWQLTLLPMRQCRPRDLAAADVLVLQRGLTHHALRLMQQMRATGGHVVYEIDDLLTAAAPHLLHFEGLGKHLGSIEQCLAEADLVTAATGRLAAALQGKARRIEVVPNFAPPLVPAARPWEPGAPLSLLFAASDRVAADFIAPAVAAVAAARPGRLQVVCIGPSAALFEAAAAAGSMQVTCAPLMPRGAFWQFVASQVNPLAVIPLDDSAFSACKSAIKFFDYAAIGVPVLCSRRPPYVDAVRDGQTGTLVDNTVPAWTAALHAVMDDPAACRRQALAAQADVAQRFSLGHTVAAWRAALASLGPRPHAARAPSRMSQLVAETMLRLRAANRARLERRRVR